MTKTTSVATKKRQTLEQAIPVVTISNDPSCLGDKATRQDLERYAENLERHLCAEFSRAGTILRSRPFSINFLVWSRGRSKVLTTTSRPSIFAAWPLGPTRGANNPGGP